MAYQIWSAIRRGIARRAHRGWPKGKHRLERGLEGVRAVLARCQPRHRDRQQVAWRGVGRVTESQRTRGRPPRHAEVAA
jgi:hypothetical protein